MKIIDSLKIDKAAIEQLTPRQENTSEETESTTPAVVRVIKTNLEHVAGYIFQVQYLVTGSVENFGGTASGPIRLQLTAKDHGGIIYETTFTPNVESIGPHTITDFSVLFSVPGYVTEFPFNPYIYVS